MQRPEEKRGATIQAEGTAYASQSLKVGIRARGLLQEQSPEMQQKEWNIRLMTGEEDEMGRRLPLNDEGKKRGRSRD